MQTVFHHLLMLYIIKIYCIRSYQKRWLKGGYCAFFDWMLWSYRFSSWSSSLLRVTTSSESKGFFQAILFNSSRLSSISRSNDCSNKVFHLQRLTFMFILPISEDLKLALYIFLRKIGCTVGYVLFYKK